MEYYGSANLTDRSRSPSPTGDKQQLPSRSAAPGGPGGPGRPPRRLPATPQKPSSLNLTKGRRQDHMPRVIPSPTIPQPHKSPGSINFPRLAASPTHAPKMNIPPGHGNPHSPIGPMPPPPGYGGPPHHPGAPMPPRMSHPYSPTDRNDLNMPGSRNSSREHLPSSRASSRGDMLDHGGPHGPPGHHRFGGNVMNNGRPDPRGADPRGSDPRFDLDRDNRFRDNSRFDPGRSMAGGAGVRPGGPHTLPNGFKPVPPGGPRPPPRRDASDSDDDDWC